MMATYSMVMEGAQILPKKKKNGIQYKTDTLNIWSKDEKSYTWANKSGVVAFFEFIDARNPISPWQLIHSHSSHYENMSGTS